MNILRRCLRVPGIRQYSTITEQAQRTDRPLRLAVIGAGPAGFYTSYRVLSKLTNAHVDMYESLPVPYGLVRFGVAPDHPEVKVPYSSPGSPPMKPTLTEPAFVVEMSREIRRSRILRPVQLHWKYSHRYLIAKSAV